MKTIENEYSEVDEELVRIGSSVDQLGESPVWSAANQSLSWVDVRGGDVRQLVFGGGPVRSLALGGLVPGVALTPGGPVVLCRRNEIALLDLASGRTVDLGITADLEPRMRFNEMKCDRAGRLWVGTMRDDIRVSQGELLRLDQGQLISVLADVTIPNTLTWSPDDTVMYFSDGQGPVIWSYAYDAAEGVPSGRREFAQLGTGLGFPDGATVDSDGYLWCANYGGWSVSRYDPSGRLDRRLAVPVSQPTSCTFGGPDLDILFITSAAQKLSDEQHRDQPLAGGLFAVRTPVAGLPEGESNLATAD